jgi:lantibiotic modifying enzyme
MFDQIESLITKQTARVEALPERALLSDAALARFSAALCVLAHTLSDSAVTQLLVCEVGDDNPLAALDPAMLTDEQRTRAEKAVNDRLNSGELSLPEPLTDILTLRLQNVTDAFIEMLVRLADHRAELGVLLPGGRTFTRIEDIVLSAGDTHNCGRSVTVLHTDAGKLVYKPRDMRGEAGVYALVKSHFSDVLGVPRCVAFGDRFGVSEFIEKRRAEGAEAARLFWYRLGGAAAVMKVLGSTDMHIENLVCSDGKPYIIDLETVISPELSNEAYKMLHPELWRLKSTSPYLSSLLPIQHEGRELSALMNTADDGCAPVVDGKRVPVCGYMEDFTAGYRELYRRILAKKEEISRFVSTLSAEMPVRILLRNTQFYHDAMLRLCHHAALADAQAWDKAWVRLEKLLRRNFRSEFEPAVQSELKQIGHGDIPYFYIYASGGDLCADGETVVKNVFNVSAEQHILNNLAAMGDKDLAFDLQLLSRSIEQYPRRLPEDVRDAPSQPLRTSEPLSREQAMEEARRQFELVFDLRIEAPEGKLFWGYMSDPDCTFGFCDTGFANGLTGIAVFAAAYAYASGDERAKERAARVVGEAVTELQRFYGYYEDMGFPEAEFPNLGESSGMGGILNGLALLRRYVGGEAIAALQEKAVLTLSRYGFSRYGAPDRMAGISGLLSVLCRFDEYKIHTELIAAAADRLLAMQTLPWKGKLLWKSFPDKPRPISGSGHGLAGVAEALFAAGAVLGEEKYVLAAEEAIRFELEAYSEKFGTWGDLRSYPPEGYMHGYCSGAPGIGIMLERIRKAGHESPALEKCAALAKRSTDELPLNARDHLCCGNSAVAEYYMTAGRFDEAGRVLAAMQRRSAEAGGYRYLGYAFHNGVTPSLFYGAGGVGYEMLRFACPEKIISVI